MTYWIIIAGPNEARVFAVNGHCDTLQYLRKIEPRLSAGSLPVAPPDSHTSAGVAAVKGTCGSAMSCNAFADELIAYLQGTFESGEFHLFTLVAPREFLDAVVARLSRKLRRHLRKCVPQDYRALATEQLQPMVQTMLPNLAMI